MPVWRASVVEQSTVLSPIQASSNVMLLGMLVTRNTVATLAASSHSASL
jgi:hypothetical protein